MMHVDKATLKQWHLCYKLIYHDLKNENYEKCFNASFSYADKFFKFNDFGILIWKISRGLDAIESQLKYISFINFYTDWCYNVPEGELLKNKDLIVNKLFFLAAAKRWDEMFVFLRRYLKEIRDEKYLQSLIKLCVDEKLSQPISIENTDELAETLQFLIVELAEFKYEFKQRDKTNIGKLILQYVRSCHRLIDSETIESPLANEQNFIEFLRKSSKGEQLYSSNLLDFKNVLPQFLENSERAKWQRPSGRTPRILVLGNNWSFLEDTIESLEAENTELRTFSYDILTQAMAATQQNNRHLPSGSEYLFVPDDIGLTKQEYFDFAVQCCPLFGEMIDWCDVVFVEWANSTAVWASRYLPSEKKLVIRCHSYEAFTHWPLFIDYKNVDEMVFIADHVRQIFLAHFTEFGELNLNTHIVPNIRNLSRFFNVQGADNRTKVLGVLGYSNWNKDPIFALKILKALLKIDSSWILRLAGHPFAEPRNKQEALYKDQFFDELSDVQDSVIMDGFVEGTETWFEEVGFILSTSLREGSHEAIVEGMASGCIPVLRNWPMVKAFGAPSSMFDGRKAYDTPEEAAAHILSVDFQSSSSESRAIARRHFDKTSDFAKLHNILVG